MKRAECSEPLSSHSPAFVHLQPRIAFGENDLKERKQKFRGMKAPHMMYGALAEAKLEDRHPLNALCLASFAKEVIGAYSAILRYSQ